MERFLIFFTCFSFLASGVSICELCSALCRCDGLHGVPWFNIAGRRHHGHSIATLTCQVLRLHRSRAGQKDPQHQSWCHGHWGGSRPTFTQNWKSEIASNRCILSLLVRGCHGAHISIALSRPRVEGKEFWVFSSDAPWTCRNREVMAISPRNPALRPLLCSCLQSVPHGKGMKVFALLLGEPDIIDTYGHIWTSYTVNCQIIINDLISNIQWYTMSNVQNTIYIYIYIYIIIYFI